MKIGKLYITWGTPPATVIKMDAKDVSALIDSQIGRKHHLAAPAGTTVRY